MSERNTVKAPPAILVLKEVIRDYRAVNDPAGLGKLLFPLEQCLSGEEYTPPKTGGELNTFNRLLEAAKKGIETYEKMSNRGKAGAAACNAAKREKQAQAANPSPSGGRSPAPVRQIEPAQGKPPAPTPAPVRRTVAQPSGDTRRGGCTRLGDGFNIAEVLGGGDSIETMIFKNPVNAALQITGETGNAKAENTLKKYVRTKGADNCAQTLYEFYAELKQGEEPDNRGKALNARLKALPDIPAQERGRGRE